MQSKTTILMSAIVEIWHRHTSAELTAQIGYILLETVSDIAIDLNLIYVDGSRYFVVG